MPPEPSNAIVIGGGLAGMATATALQDAGMLVTLLEANRRLGGRASSFEDPQTGTQLDNCQHVLLGCCTNLIDFYRRLGVADLVRFERTMHFRDGNGRRCDLLAQRHLPAPLHLGPSMLSFSLLTPAQRLAAARAMLAMMRLGRDGRRGLEQTTFGAWLEQHGQPAALIDNFYNPLLLGALNEDCRLASAAAAIQVFQDALLSHSGGYFLGLPTCPLARLYAAGPCRDVRLAARVAEVRIVGDRVAGLVLHNGQILHADVYILATNHHTVRKLLGGDAALIDSRLPGLERLESAPILGAHLWFDRPLLRESHSAIIHGPLQWVFRKDAAGKAVHGVISAAWDWLDVPRDQCLKMFAQQLASAFPEAADAKLERGIIVIEKRATFRPLPGMEHLRPSQAPPAGGIANLFLAGDYTQTGWPATMEGAIRGGYLAAEAVLNATGHPRRFLVPDLPSQWPMRLLGRAGGRTRRQL